MSNQALTAQVRLPAPRPGNGAPDAGVPLEGGMEHRLGVRVPICIPVTLDHAGETPVFGRMLNVSLSGAYVETRTRFPLLTRINLACEWALQNHSLEPCITAFVTRMSPVGVAIEWLDFAPQAVRDLMSREQSQGTHGSSSSTISPKSPSTLVPSFSATLRPMSAHESGVC